MFGVLRNHVTFTQTRVRAPRARQGIMMKKYNVYGHPRALHIQRGGCVCVFAVLPASSVSGGFAAVRSRPHHTSHFNAFCGVNHSESMLSTSAAPSLSSALSISMRARSTPLWCRWTPIQCQTRVIWGRTGSTFLRRTKCSLMHHV